MTKMQTPEQPKYKNVKTRTKLANIIRAIILQNASDLKFIYIEIN